MGQKRIWITLLIMIALGSASYVCAETFAGNQYNQQSGTVEPGVSLADKQDESDSSLADKPDEPGVKYLEIAYEDLLARYSDSQKQIQYMAVSYAIDVDDYAVLMNFADYCFVGQIRDILGVQMDSALQREAGTSGSPYTVYDVAVERDIKGGIEQGSEIRVLKKGGLLADRETFEMLDEDNMPEIGKYYIFFAAVQQDHTLMASGKNSTIECRQGLEDTLIDEMKAVDQNQGQEGQKPKSFSLDLDKITIKP